MTDPETKGIAIRYLPGILAFSYQEYIKQNKGLTIPEFSRRIKDPGEIQAARIYEVDNTSYIFLHNTPRLRRKYAVSQIGLPQQTLKDIYRNNQQYFNLHFSLQGGDEDYKNIDPLVFAVTQQVFLSTYWAILELTDLTQFEPTNFEGYAATNLGMLKVVSA